MKQVLAKLKNHLPQSTEAEEQVIRIILRNPRSILNQSVQELAKAGFCSPSTVVRLCQKMGFQGLKEMKLAISEELGYAGKTRTADYDHALPFKEMAGMQMELYTSALRQTYALVNDSEVEKAAALIQNANVIHLYGIGASFIVAEDLMMKLVRIKKTCCLYHDIHLQLVDAGNVGVDEVCMIISYSGQTQELIRAAEKIKANGGILITLTQYSENRLTRLADYRLYVPKTEEGLRVSAGSSRICQLAMIDFLFGRILARNYEEDMMRIVDSSILLEKEPEVEKAVQSSLENDIELEIDLEPETAKRRRMEDKRVHGKEDSKTESFSALENDLE